VGIASTELTRALAQGSPDCRHRQVSPGWIGELIAGPLQPLVMIQFARLISSVCLTLYR